MRRQQMVALGFASVMLAPPAHAISGSPGTYLAHLKWSISLLLEAISAGYRAAPALMLGLVALLAMPLMALVSGIGALRRRRRGLPVRSLDESELAIASAPQMHASLEVVGENGTRIAILHDMLRIGRESDNDIRIRSQSVHRYHAAIYREDFGIYRIADLGGDDGNGVCVNGERCEETELKDGDLIELGPRCLRFHAGLL